MKATGIVRKVDELGRMVIPKEIRDTLNFNTEDPLEIFVEEQKIILSKYSPGCTFCDSPEDVVDFKGKKICEECLDTLNQINDSE